MRAQTQCFPQRPSAVNAAFQCCTSLTLLFSGVFFFAGAVHAQTQNPGLPQVPGVQAARAEAAASEGVRNVDTTAGAGTRTSGDVSSFLGLKEPGQRQTLTLGQVIARLDNDNADVAIAAERLIQSEAGVRKAWSLLLPQVALTGAYTHTCTGGTTGLQCADRTTQLADADQLEQQADLFDGIGDVLEVVANNTADPDEQARLRQDAADLKSAATKVRQTDTTPVVVQPASVWTAGVSLAIPIFNGRALPALFNAYTATEIARASQQQLKNALVYSVTRSYLTAVTAKKLAAIADEQVQQSERHLAATQARVSAATQPVLSLQRAKLDVLRAKQQRAQSRSAYETAIAGLGLVMGADEAFDVAQEGPTATTHAGEVEALVEQAVASRPDLVMQRRALDVANNQVTDAWMMFLPTVNLVTRASASSFTSGFVKDPITGTLTLTASVPLYDGGLRYGAMRDATSKVREEKIRLKQQEDRVRAQVRGNVREAAVQAESLLLARETLAVAQVAYEQAQTLFEVGAGTALDVSDAQVRLFVAESDVLRTEHDVQMAALGLSYVLGEALAPARSSTD